jgi:3-phenylpropionate/trans-cinnamate dioxygenase ferredoxin reductase component
MEVSGMSDDRTFVIVGASLAGAKAAQALRENGFEGRIVLVGAENERPYERPPLSKGYLIGKEPAEKAYVHPENFYAEHNIDLRLGVQATAIHRDAHEVELDTGERLHYDKLLLTTGSSVVRLKIPGGELEGVHYLRTLADSTRLKSALANGGQVVVVGGCWIVLEVASAARHYGASVVLVEPQQTPLFAVLGAELGEFFAQVHRDHGVDLRLGVGVTEFKGDGTAVRSVVASDGSEVPADTVVVGVGIRPNVALAADAGLLVDNGIVVDEYLRTTDDDIFAAGDVANAHNPQLGRQIRVEHWANAQDQGPAAAKSMLGADEPYTKVPYFFSDQYDVGMEYSGLARPGEYDDVVYRGDPASREFCVFWLDKGSVVAGMNVNVWDVHSDIRALIKSGAQVDAARLADPAVPLADAAK